MSALLYRLVLSFFCLLMFNFLGGQCLEYPVIDGTPCAACTPAGFTAFPPAFTPDIIDDSGNWPGGGCTISNLSGLSPAGNNMTMLVSDAGGYAEGITTTVTNLTPGQEYAFGVYWEQMTVSCSGLVYNGGNLVITIDGVSTTYSGAVDWELIQFCVLAISTTMDITFEIEFAGQGAIVIDSPLCEQLDPCCELVLELAPDTINICPGENVVLNASYSGESGPVNIMWTSTPPDGVNYLSSTTTISPTFSFPTNTDFDGASYNFLLSIEDDSCEVLRDIEVVIGPAYIPEFDISICAADDGFVMPGTSEDGYTGTWSGNFDFENLGGTSQDYTFILDDGQNNCIEEWIYSVDIAAAEIPVFNLPPTMFCELEEDLYVLTNPSENGIFGTWSQDNFMPSEFMPGTHTISFEADLALNCASDFDFDITIEASVIPSFDIPTEFCQQDSLYELPQISLEGAVGFWGEDFIDLNISTSNQTIAFIPFNGSGCFDPATHTYSVFESVEAEFSFPTEFCESDDNLILPQISDNGIMGSWTVPLIDPGNITDSLISTFIPDDNQGFCTNTQDVTFSISASIVPTFNLPAMVCASDSIITFTDISLEGISGSWEFSSLDPATTAQDNFQNTFTPDVLGCFSISEINIDIISLNNLIAVGADPTECGANDGTVTINNGGDSYEYSIDNGQSWQSDSLFTGLGAGLYTVQMRSIVLMSCINTQDLSLSSQSAPEIISIAPTNQSDCDLENGSIEVFASGDNLEYSIDNGQSWQSDSVFNNLPPGNYNIIVQSDIPGCTTSATASIEAYIAPQLIDVSIQEISDCTLDDGAILIEGTGDSLEYSIDNGQSWQNDPTFEFLSEGQYEILIRPKNAPNCIEDTTVTLNPIAYPEIINIDPTNPVSCTSSDGSIIITATGTNVEYSIDGGLNWSLNNEFTMLAAGIYEIVIKNGGTTHCLDLDTVSLSLPALPDISYISENPSLCFPELGEITVESSNDNVEFSIDGGLSWNTTGYFSGLEAGNYTVQVKNLDAPDCINSQDVQLTEDLDSIDILNSFISFPTDCISTDGEIIIETDLTNVEFSIDGGISWQASNVFDQLAPGDYVILIRSLNSVNCETEFFATIDSTPCPCGTPDLEWEVSLVDCEDLNSGTIEITNVGNIIFQDDFEINWSSGQQGEMLENLSSGWYAFQIDYDLNCAFQDSIFVGAYAPIDFDLEGQDLDCKNEAQIQVINLSGGAGNYDISLNGGPFQKDSTFNNLQAGDYDVIVEDSIGCTSSGNISLSSSLLLDLDIQEVQAIYPGETVVLIPEINPIEIDSFIWTPAESILNPGEINAEVAPLVTTSYTLTIFYGDCTETRTIIVTVLQSEVFTPNVFSPNSDGINDYFYIQGPEESNYELLEFQIYDRWGNLMFNKQNAKINDPSEGWDGTFNGKLVSPGVYVYSISIQNLGKVTKYSGDITVVR